MNPLGQILFKEKCTNDLDRASRSATSNKIRPPVPDYSTLATNLMSRVWNDLPELQNAQTLTAARRIARKWAEKLPR